MTGSHTTFKCTFLSLAVFTATCMPTTFVKNCQEFVLLSKKSRNPGNQESSTWSLEPGLHWVSCFLSSHASHLEALNIFLWTDRTLASRVTDSKGGRNDLKRFSFLLSAFQRVLKGAGLTPQGSNRLSQIRPDLLLLPKLNKPLHLVLPSQTWVPAN